MPLYLGIPFTIAIIVLAGSIRVGRFTLEWAAALAGALWAVWQSRRYQLERFERVFPLEPLPLGVTVFFLFPFTFPWFLRLRHKALRGRLPLRTRPSRLRLALIGIVVVGGLAINLAVGFLRRAEPWKKIETSMLELQAAAGGMVNYEVRGSVVTLTVENESLYRADPIVQRDTARAIARKALAVFGSSLGALTGRVSEVELVFTYLPSRMATRSESARYRFPVSELE